MAVNDTYRLRIIMRRSAVHPACINNFYFTQLDDTIFDTPGEDLIQAWQDGPEADYTNLFTNLLAIVQYQVAKAPLFLTEHIADFTGIPGGLSGDPLPPRTSICLSNRTPVLTARGRGRVYLPPANEASSTTGAPIVTYVNAVKAFGDSLLPFIGDGVTTSRWSPAMWSETDQATRDITSYFVTPIWTSQRDRDGILSA